MSHTAVLEAEQHVGPRGAKIGMWLFLFTELLLFGGLFLLYSVYRMKFPTDFHNAATDLNTLVGTINTIILLTSSLTMVLSIVAMEKGNKKLAVLLLIVTILCGLIFLVNKYFEWKMKFEHGLYPGSAELDSRNHGEVLFFGLYFVMTGLHALHVLIGMAILGVMAVFLVKNPYEKIKISPHQLSHLNGTQLCIVGEKGDSVWPGIKIDKSVKHITMTIAFEDSKTNKVNMSDMIKLENAGLYWHLVDIIWIFLFPLFYLIT